MNALRFRAVVVPFLLGLFLVPAFAHHGNPFLSRAMEITATQIRLGELARNRSHQPDIRIFAEAFEADQNSTLHKLMDLRAARTVIRATPVSANNFVAQAGWDIDRMHRSAADLPMTPDHRRTVERLSSIPAQEFDRQFVSEIVREYRETITFFEEQMHVHGNEVINRPGRDVQDYSPEDLLKDLDTVDFAIASLPALRLRLKQAEALQKHLQKR